MKIALIYPPPVPLLTKRTSQNNSITGLGLLYLATQVKDKHDVTILGATTNPVLVTDMIEQISKLQPDVLGISTIFTTLMIGGKLIAEEIKKRFPSVVTVFGGNHATFTYEQLLKEPYADIVVRGEGEITFKELIECLDAGLPLDNVHGLAFKRDGKIVLTPQRVPIRDINEIPFPDWSLVNDAMPDEIPMCSSRGCPHDCIYCSTTSFWTRKWRARSAQNMIDEINAIFDRYKPAEKKLTIAFVDDNFTVDRKRALEFCRLIRENNFKLDWGISSRVELLDDVILKALSCSGCNLIFMGIESGSERVLKKMKRNYTPEMVKEKVQLCLDYGIIPTCSFMVGNPYEDASDIEATFSLIQTLKSYKVQVHIFTPLIGTPVFHDPEKYGVEILSSDNESMTLEAKAQLNTSHLKAKEIENLYHKGVGLVLRRHRESRILNMIASQNRENLVKKCREESSADNRIPEHPTPSTDDLRNN